MTLVDPEKQTSGTTQHDVPAAPLLLIVLCLIPKAKWNMLKCLPCEPFGTPPEVDLRLEPSILNSPQESLCWRIPTKNLALDRRG